ncbi:hypothetical protein ACJX0J_017083, partial [Zea mays]
CAGDNITMFSSLFDVSSPKDLSCAAKAIRALDDKKQVVRQVVVRCRHTWQSFASVCNCSPSLLAFVMHRASCAWFLLILLLPLICLVNIWSVIKLMWKILAAYGMKNMWHGIDKMNSDKKIKVYFLKSNRKEHIYDKISASDAKSLGGLTIGNVIFYR